MVGVHKYVGGSLHHTLINGGRDDNVLLADSMLKVSIASVSSNGLNHSEIVEPILNRGEREELGVAWKSNNRFGQLTNS